MKVAANRDVREVGDEKYSSRDLSNFFNLVTHSEKRTPRDMFQRVLMAVFLLRGLTQCGYFGENVTFKPELSADQSTVGAAILLALQVTQFNSHEVAEMYALDSDSGEHLI
jgi:hypothetical protein